MSMTRFSTSPTHCHLSGTVLPCIMDDSKHCHSVTPSLRGNALRSHNLLRHHYCKITNPCTSSNIHQMRVYTDKRLLKIQLVGARSICKLHTRAHQAIYTRCACTRTNTQLLGAQAHTHTHAHSVTRICMCTHMYAYMNVFSDMRMYMGTGGSASLLCKKYHCQRSCVCTHVTQALHTNGVFGV
jgi:hypothetical protein